MRARITDEDGRVFLSYDGEDGQRITRRFFCDGHPSGYVYEVTLGWPGDGTNKRQVCHELACTGNTLYCDASRLVNLIRREYRAMRRSEARLAKRGCW